MDNINTKFHASCASNILEKLGISQKDIDKTVKKMSKHINGMNIDVIIIVLLTLIELIISASETQIKKHVIGNMILNLSRINEFQELLNINENEEMKH